MPRKDIFHESVKIGLEKDGWVVTDDPLLVTVDETTIFIDLGLEPVYYAEKGEQHIAVEVKSFRIQSSITAFYEAVGKFCVYKTTLALSRFADLGFTLYLAVPKNIYDTFFKRRIVEETLKRYEVNYLVYNPLNDTIITWKKY
jgi:hypothetical protein